MTQDKRRRQRGEGAVYPHKRDANGNVIRYAGQLELPWSTGEDGKRRRRTVYGRTEREVLQKMTKLRRQLEDAGDLPTADTTLTKWLEYWLREIAIERLKPSTYRAYRMAVKEHIGPTIGRHRLGQLSTQHVRQMHQSLRARTPPLSSTTILHAHRVLSVALNDAIREGRVGRNVAALTRAPSKAVNKRTALSVEEAIKVLTVAANEPLGTRWLAALLLGVRQGERLGLRWSHLDLEAGVADISWSLQRVTYSHGCVDPERDPICGKKRGASCADRRLIIADGIEHEILDGNLVLMRPKTEESQRLAAIIEPLRLALLRRLADVKHERPSYDVDHDLVWCRPDGRPLDPRDDWADWKTVLAKAGVRDVTGHETRHTTATLLLELGVAPRVVQELLGHSQMVTTQGYQHVSLALQREALGALGQRLELTGGDEAA